MDYISRNAVLYVFILASLVTAEPLMTLFFSSNLSAHERGAPFSSAIIDPIVTHHAHIENEQKLNFSFFHRFRQEEGGTRPMFMGSLEFAWTSNYRWGVETTVPFSDQGKEREYGLGDIEIWPLKYSFINRSDTILAGVLGFTLPSGSTSKGLGEGNLVLEPHFLLDKAFRNWFLGLNLIPGVNLTGKAGSELEYNTVLAYSFIRGTDRIASPIPRQRFVFSPFCEFLGESAFSGEEAGEHSFSLLPGFSLWHVGSGWILRMGASFPLTSTRESDLVFYLQIGNHVSWGDLVKRGLRR